MLFQLTAMTMRPYSRGGLEETREESNVAATVAGGRLGARRARFGGLPPRPECARAGGQVEPLPVAAHLLPRPHRRGERALHPPWPRDRHLPLVQRDERVGLLLDRARRQPRDRHLRLTLRPADRAAADGGDRGEPGHALLRL